ncbi:MAG: hypothetical protein ACTSXT_00090 [Candidatus Helarchaeota archaeon]
MHNYLETYQKPSVQMNPKGLSESGYRRYYKLKNMFGLEKL